MRGGGGVRSCGVGAGEMDGGNGGEMGGEMEGRWRRKGGEMEDGCGGMAGGSHDFYEDMIVTRFLNGEIEIVGALEIPSLDSIAGIWNQNIG